MLFWGTLVSERFLCGTLSVLAKGTARKQNVR